MTLMGTRQKGCDQAGLRASNVCYLPRLLNDRGHFGRATSFSNISNHSLSDMFRSYVKSQNTPANCSGDASNVKIYTKNKTTSHIYRPEVNKWNKDDPD